MKKRLFAIPLMAIAAVCMVLLGACGGPSVEDLIRDDLTEQFDALKNGDDEFIDALEDSAGSEFETLGIDPAEYASAYLEGFDYEIGDITVEDSTATAHVTLTLKSMNTIINDFSTQFQEEIEAIDDPTSITEEDLYKRAGEIMVEVTKNTEPKTVECDFTYSKDSDNVWSADDAAGNELMNAMLS